MYTKSSFAEKPTIFSLEALCRKFDNFRNKWKWQMALTEFSEKHSHKIAGKKHRFSAKLWLCVHFFRQCFTLFSIHFFCWFRVKPHPIFLPFQIKSILKITLKWPVKTVKSYVYITVAIYLDRILLLCQFMQICEIDYWWCSYSYNFWKKILVDICL